MILQFKDVVLGYENKTVAKDINFEIKKGDYLCIVGENGAGKSTLVKTLLGLIKPLLGKITINLDKSKKGIFTTADCSPKRFPGKCYGSCVVRLFK